MNDEQMLQIADQISEDIFGRKLNFSSEQIEKRLTAGITLPKVLTCSRTDVPVYIYDPQPEYTVLSEEAFRDQSAQNDWMIEKTDIKNIEDFLQAWKGAQFMDGSKSRESNDVTKSDSVASSEGIYMSSLIGNSKNILFSHNNFFSNYLLACRGNSSCNFGIRIFDSIYCSSSYEVRWSNKVTKSMFINNCLDLYECIGCFGIRSKKYCIANMQFEKEEYMKIKEMILDWIFDGFKK